MRWPITIFIALWFPFLIVCALLLASYECIKIIASNYGVNMSEVVPGIETSSEIGPPIFLLGAAVFAHARGRKIRIKREKIAAVDAAAAIEKVYDEESFALSSSPSWLELISIPFAIFAFVTVPFWLNFPVPTAWACIIFALYVFSLVRYGRKGRGLYD